LAPRLDLEPVILEDESPRRLSYRVGRVVYTVDAERGYYMVREPVLPRELEQLAAELAAALAREGVEPGRESVARAAERLGASRLVGDRVDDLVYHVEKLMSPWGFLYPIMLDPWVEEVSVTAGGRVSVVHRLVLSMEYLDSSIVAPGGVEFDEYLQRLAAAAGTAVSPAFPVAEAELEGSRVTIVLGVVANASTLSVRKQPRVMPSLEDLVEDGVLTWEAAEYLLEVLRSRGMVFIVGPQGTGKTTLLNALMEKLPRDWKLVAIEDVPELRPRHPRFVSLRVRRARSLAESRSVEIGFQELLRAALRLRGQFTAITEARGPEVLDLFEAAALGEASAATFHARDWRELKLRLLKLGVREDMLPLLWAVVVMARVRVGRELRRRVVAIYEVDLDGSERLVYRYDSGLDRLVRVAEPVRVHRLEAPVAGGGS